VDGRVGIRKTAGDLLTALGFHCHTAASPSAGLRAVRAKAVDIVLCEHALPQTDALPFVEALRQRSFEGKVFVYANQLEAAERELWAKCRVDRLVLGPGGLADMLQELEVLSVQSRAVQIEAWPTANARAQAAPPGVAVGAQYL